MDPIPNDNQPNADNMTNPTTAPDPSPTPAPSPAPDNIAATPNPNTGNGTPKPQSKNRKIAIISASIAGTVLLAGGVTAYAITNQPEYVVLSAMSNLINADNIAISGDIEVLNTAVEEHSNEFESVKISIEEGASASDLASTSTANIKIGYSGHTFEISLGSVIVDNGVVYIKLDKLKDAFNEFKSMAQSENSDETSESDTTLEDFIGELLGSIDGTWWRIDISSLVKKLKMETKAQDAYKNYYQCVYNAVSTEIDKRSEYADLYKEHKFLEVSPYTGSEIESMKGVGKLYGISIDTGELSAFKDAVANREITDNLESCSSTFSKELYGNDHYHDDDYYNVPQEDFSKSTDCINLEGEIEEGTDCVEVETGEPASEIEESDLPNKIIVATRGVFNHHLTGLYISDASSHTSYTGTLKFNYDKQNISAPDDSKDVTEIVDKITETTERILSRSFETSTGNFL